MAKQQAAPEAYTVLARRYRPQGFGDLVGQEAVARALVNALKANRVAHAYLFTGARGVGKTADEESLNTVRAIGNVRTGAGDRPTEPVTVESVAVTEKNK